MRAFRLVVFCQTACVWSGIKSCAVFGWGGVNFLRDSRYGPYFGIVLETLLITQGNKCPPCLCFRPRCLAVWNYRRDSHSFNSFSNTWVSFSKSCGKAQTVISEWIIFSARCKPCRPFFFAFTVWNKNASVPKDECMMFESWPSLPPKW